MCVCVCPVQQDQSSPVAVTHQPADLTKACMGWKSAGRQCARVCYGRKFEVKMMVQCPKGKQVLDITESEDYIRQELQERVVRGAFAKNTPDVYTHFIIISRLPYCAFSIARPTFCEVPK